MFRNRIQAVVTFIQRRNKMISVIRKGDTSLVTFIEFSASETGVTVCVHPDKDSTPVSESIRLCGANAGGVHDICMQL
ncbi:MAG: hypothetical protein RI935_313 [Candidatus Parcubacteria bacterium]|jgi:hypothetical protein